MKTNETFKKYVAKIMILINVTAKNSK